jgi:hypothetical protein
VRNKEVGHIQIDYRIACAMYNYNHKPVVPDGKHAEEIANKIKKKLNIQNNKLR